LAILSWIYGDPVEAIRGITKTATVPGLAICYCHDYVPIVMCYIAIALCYIVIIIAERQLLGLAICYCYDYVPIVMCYIAIALCYIVIIIADSKWHCKSNPWPCQNPIDLAQYMASHAQAHRLRAICDARDPAQTPSPMPTGHPRSVEPVPP
jgi:hypothetical protein